ncbi:MAG TPA: hypothetical protein VN578_17540 [Candidatus Binatia bacterium]|jgi:hypothetical protein|nr:hypothetical protein [Candidatus Binatia bacterium]
MRFANFCLACGVALAANVAAREPGPDPTDSEHPTAPLPSSSLELGPAATSSSLSLGPLFDEFPLTLAPGHRMEAAGPLFYSEQKDTERTWAVPPLFSHTVDPALELEEFDFAYPLMTYDRYGRQYRWQFLQLLSLAGGPTQTENVRNRFTLFPFYFQQRSDDPTQNYTAVGPFYGHLQNRLFHDEIFFVMFPLYSKTRKRDVVTDNYVYPFFHLRHGDGLYGWQFWPLVGNEHKEVTMRTNNFGDVESIGGHDSFFVLWPFFFNDRSGLGTANPVWMQGSIPAYSFMRSPLRDSTTVLWPFFSRVDDREKKYREWDVPWPFIEFARGPGKTTTRVWPLFSRAHSDTLEDNFYLWPVYKYEAIHSEPLERHRTRILFFLYSDTFEKSTETGASRRRVDLLPLFTHQRELNGNIRLQVLAPLEPFTSGSHKIERDYSQLWSLWRAEKNPKTGAASQSLLWNLYRRDTAPGYKKLSLLLGLFQSQSDATGSRVRVFYIPLGKGKARAQEAER